MKQHHKISHWVKCIVIGLAIVSISPASYASLSKHFKGLGNALQNACKSHPSKCKSLEAAICKKTASAVQGEFTKQGIGGSATSQVSALAGKCPSGSSSDTTTAPPSDTTDSSGG